MEALAASEIETTIFFYNPNIHPFDEYELRKEENIRFAEKLGMPIIDADKARVVVVIKRSLNVGYAGVDNDLFFEDKTMMLFGDGKKMMNELNSAIKEF